GAAVGIAALTSVLFGVLPAVRLSRVELGTRDNGRTRRESRVQSALVAGQLVAATVLLVGAGLLIRSFVALVTTEQGYDASNTIVFQVVFPPGYPIARKVGAIERALQRLRGLPDVVAAGSTRAGVLIGEEIFIGTFVPEGHSIVEMQADPMRPHLRPVSD